MKLYEGWYTSKNGNPTCVIDDVRLTVRRNPERLGEWTFIVGGIMASEHESYINPEDAKMSAEILLGKLKSMNIQLESARSWIIGQKWFSRKILKAAAGTTQKEFAGTFIPATSRNPAQFIATEVA